MLAFISNLLLLPQLLVVCVPVPEKYCQFPGSQPIRTYVVHNLPAVLNAWLRSSCRPLPQRAVPYSEWESKSIEPEVPGYRALYYMYYSSVYTPWWVNIDILCPSMLNGLIPAPAPVPVPVLVPVLALMLGLGTCTASTCIHLARQTRQVRLAAPLLLPSPKQVSHHQIPSSFLCRSLTLTFLKFIINDQDFSGKSSTSRHSFTPTSCARWVFIVS